METKTLRITPETAKIMLKKNAVNRPLKKMTIEIYTRQMMRGLWREETGEAIKFEPMDLFWMDEHRLHSVVNANVALNFLVINGLDTNF